MTRTLGRLGWSVVVGLAVALTVGAAGLARAQGGSTVKPLSAQDILETVRHLIELKNWHAAHRFPSRG